MDINELAKQATLVVKSIEAIVEDVQKLDPEVEHIFNEYFGGWTTTEQFEADLDGQSKQTEEHNSEEA